MSGQPPHDIDAEQCVLGAMLMSDQAVADVAEILGPADHYRPAHQIIHEVILDLRERGQRPEPVAVKDEIRRRKQLRQMGGAPYLHTLQAAVPTAASAAHYARIVAEMADRRRAIEDAERLKQQAESPDAEFAGSRFSARDWDAPVPLGSRRSVPEFPVDALPAWVGGMVRATAIETQTPADIPGTLALAALSTAAGGRVQVRVRDGWSEPVNLYLAAIAEPGTRKSAVYQAITLPLSAAENSLESAMAQERYEAQIKRDRLEDDYRRKQAEAVKAADGNAARVAIDEAAEAAKKLESARVIAPVQLITGDISPEECTTILAAQGGRLAIMSAEGRIFDIITGRYSNGQPCLSPFLEGHAGDPLRVNRRERHEIVERPALTIGVCIQPAVLTEVMTKPRLRGQGMLARILYALPPDHVGRRVSEPPATPAEVRDRYAADLEAMVLSLAQNEPPTLTLDDAALKVIVGYLDEIEPRLRSDGDLYGIRDWAAKLAGAAVRIAGLLHVAEHLKDGYRQPIAESTMIQAITIASYYAEHALAAFGVMSAHPSVRLAYDILAWRRPPDGPAGGEARFTQRDAHRKFEGRVRSVGEIAAALRLLEDHGYIRPVPQQGPPRGGGRPPSPAYSVIPYSAIPVDGRQNRQNPENGG